MEKTTIEKNYQALLEMREFNLSHFYSLSITEYSISLQGHFTTAKAKYYSEMGFVFTFDQHCIGKSEILKQISIILT